MRKLKLIASPHSGQDSAILLIDTCWYFAGAGGRKEGKLDSPLVNWAPHWLQNRNLGRRRAPQLGQACIAEVAPFRAMLISLWLRSDTPNCGPQPPGSDCSRAVQGYQQPLSAGSLRTGGTGVRMMVDQLPFALFEPEDVGCELIETDHRTLRRTQLAGLGAD